MQRVIRYVVSFAMHVRYPQNYDNLIQSIIHISSIYLRQQVKLSDEENHDSRENGKYKSLGVVLEPAA